MRNLNTTASLGAMRLALHNMLNMPVTCSNPVKYPGWEEDTESVNLLATGDKGRIVSIVPGNQDIKILVLMDSQGEDCLSFPYNKFLQHFQFEEIRRSCLPIWQCVSVSL